MNEPAPTFAVIGTQQLVLETARHHHQQQQQQPLMNLAAADLEPLVLPPNFMMAFTEVPPSALFNPQNLSEADDPYAPIPLHEIIAQEHAERRRRASAAVDVQQQHPARQNGHPHPVVSGVAAASGVQARTSLPSMRMTESFSAPPPPSQPPTDRARETHQRKQKEQFLVFLRVLFRYLEQKNPSLHQKAKMIVKDCAERNKRKEPGFESVTASMRERIRKLVGEAYWVRAESYFKHCIRRSSHQHS